MLSNTPLQDKPLALDWNLFSSQKKTNNYKIIDEQLLHEADIREFPSFTLQRSPPTLL